MERFEIGMLAVSRAGHDKDCLYVISAIDGEYVYLTDGKVKPLERPKKKKKKHIQVIRIIPEDLCGAPMDSLKNEDIKRVIKHYRKSQKIDTVNQVKKVSGGF